MTKQGSLLPSDIGLQNIKFDIALNLHKLKYDASLSPPKHPDLIRLTNNDIDVSKMKIGGKVMAKVYNLIDRIHPKPVISNQLLNFIKVANQNLLLHEAHLHDKSPPEIVNETQKHAINFTSRLNQLPDFIIQLYSLMNDFKKIQACQSKCSRRSHSSLNKQPITLMFEDLGIEFFFGKNYVSILISGIYYLVTHDQLTMISNKIHEIYNTLFLGWCHSGSIWNKDFYDKQIKLLDFMSEMLGENDNQAYTIFKNFDGIVSGIILKEEKHFDNSNPLDTILNELISTRLVSGYHIRLLKTIFQGTSHELLELSAMSKLLGHPDIQSSVGIDKLRLRVSKRNEANREDIVDLLSSMKKNFIHHFFLREKRWPTVECHPNTNPRLIFCIFQNVWIHDPTIPQNLPAIKLADFTHLDLGKIALFDHIDSQFDILKDTALAAIRSEIQNPNLHSIKDLKSRRTLLYFLMSSYPHLEVRNYFKNLAERDPIGFEYLVIKLTQKERELKEEGRFFGQSPFLERMRRCILEANVAKLFEKYNRSQAMTLSELQKMQKLYTLSRIGALKTGVIPIFISVDVEAWNNNFRRSVCEPVGREFFNKIFGVPYFQNVMDTFENSLITVTDGLLEYYWDGQLGGIEGLFQKYWTWMYESVAARVADVTGYPNFIMVNGDDLRVVLLVPKSDFEGKDTLEFVKTIAMNFEKNYSLFGFKLKIQETYFSTNYLGFGKIYVHDGHFCSNTLKKGAKLHGLANLMGDYPLEYLKGVMSETLSTMSYSVGHRFIYLVGLINYQFHLSNYLPEYDKLDLTSAICLLNYPANFGGLPMIPYLRCLYKGESDVETCWISFYFYVLRENQALGERLLKNALASLRKAENAFSLAINPYGLSNSSPPEGITLIQSFIRSKLENIVENRDFLTLIRQTSELKKERFLKALFSCNPVPAKPLSVLYDTSAAGLVDEFLKKFEASKSIGGFITGNFTKAKSVQLLNKAKRFDVTKIYWCYNHINKSNSELSSVFSRLPNGNECPTEFSNKLRNWCYNKEIIGITYPCVVDQVQFYSLQNPIDPNSKDYVTIWRDSIPPGVDINYSHGSKPLFLGNHTHLKLLSPELELQSTSAGLRRVTKLLKVYSMMKSLGPQCIEFIKQNLKDLTGLNPDKLCDLSYTHVSGSITHRVPTNHWSPLVGPNDLSNKSTYISSSTSTDHTSRLRPGDWTVNYGLIRAHLINVLLYESEFSKSIYPSVATTYWLKISNCPTCTYEVTDRPVEWLLSPPSIQFNLLNNIYVTLNNDELDQLKRRIDTVLDSMIQKTRHDLNYQDPDHRDLARKLIARVIIRSHTEELKNQLSNDLDEDFDETDLSILYLLPSVDLATLTDLKALPSNYLFQELVVFFTDWVFKNYPTSFDSDNWLIVNNLHHSKLPFNGLSKSLIESGYWPLLSQSLKLHTQLDPPTFNCSDSVTIQRFLIASLSKYCASTMETGMTDQRVYIITITGRPTDDEYLAQIKTQFNLVQNQIMISWLSTEQGRNFRLKIRAQLFEDCKSIINDLCCIKTICPDKIPNIEDELETYSYDRNKGCNMLLQALERIMSLSDSQYMSKVLFNYLKEFEEGKDDTEPISYFIRRKIQICVLPISQASNIVRELGNQEFQDLYKMKAHVSQKLPVTLIPRAFKITKKSSMFSKILINFNLEAIRYDTTIQEERLSRIIKPFDRMNQNSGLAILFRAFISNEGKVGHHIIFFCEALMWSRKDHLTILTLDDIDGSATVAFLKYYVNGSVLNLSKNLSDPGNPPGFKEFGCLDQLDLSRLNLTFSSSLMNDYQNTDIQDALLKHYSEQKTKVNICFLTDLSNMAFFNKNSLMSLLEKLLETHGLFILHINASKLTNIQFLQLLQIGTHFTGIEIWHSDICSMSGTTLFLIFRNFQKPMSFNQIVITTEGLQSIDQFFKIYIQTPDDRYKLITPNQWIALTQNIKLLKKDYTLSPLYNFSNTLQSIVMSMLSCLINVNYIDMEKSAQETLTKLQMSLIGFNFDPETKSDPSMLHKKRLYIECEDLKSLLKSLKEIDSIEDLGHWLMEHNDPNYGILLEKLDKNVDLIKFVGEDWLKFEGNKFHYCIIRFSVWIWMKYNILTQD